MSDASKNNTVANSEGLSPKNSAPQNDGPQSTTQFQQKINQGGFTPLLDTLGSMGPNGGYYSNYGNPSLPQARFLNSLDSLGQDRLFQYLSYNPFPYQSNTGTEQRQQFTQVTPSLNPDDSNLSPFETAIPPSSTKSNPTTPSDKISTPPQKPVKSESGDKKHSKQCESKKAKRKKVTRACVYCRRSHMTCNETRPCARCLIRNIGHLCHDQDSPCANSQGSSKSLPGSQSTSMEVSVSGNNSPKAKSSKKVANLPLAFASEHMDNEYKVISHFLNSLEDGNKNSHPYSHPYNQTENFLMTAADPSDGTFEERLREIITAKYHAGLLRPYNYVNGYSRLQKFMDTNMSPTSRQRILNAISTFRPTFRQIAKSLTDIDLVLVEEGFERLMLDYDRVFSSMGIPACLWRRTGEIFKGNKEFAALIGIPDDQLKEGKVCVYELMTEDSAVSYWDKYGNIAFDPQQKAMLSSCSLRNRRSNADPHPIPCCFSFTIRRDKYNIPIAIVGNFLPIYPGNIYH